jgi:regulator of protease activity HflC (stomatin/prohibitin superfamily)
MPVLDRIRYLYNTKEQGIVIPHQSSVTRDNVIVSIDGVLFLRIVDTVKASYNIENPLFNVTNLAQTTMRSEIGKIALDKLFQERELLNVSIVNAIAREASEWGVECKRYEIRDISVSDIVRQSMDFQAEAERKKRKAILQSEGEMEARVNEAKGEAWSSREVAEGNAVASIKRAEAEAKALEISTDAVCKNIEKLSASLSKPGAKDAVALRLAEQYIEQFGNLAREGNTMVLSHPSGDPAAAVTSAMGIFSQITTAQKNAAAKAGSEPPRL